ncbi:MAG: hypothetical protein FJ244_03495 [Nitrospira sp.]|nr:hypothetical protein [Nitrospira sp.]
MDRGTLVSWLTLQSIAGVGDGMLLKLVHAFGSQHAVLSVDQNNLIQARCDAELVGSIRRGPPPTVRQ